MVDVDWTIVLSTLQVQKADRPLFAHACAEHTQRGQWHHNKMAPPPVGLDQLCEKCNGLDSFAETLMRKQKLHFLRAVNESCSLKYLF